MTSAPDRGVATGVTSRHGVSHGAMPLLQHHDVCRGSFLMRRKCTIGGVQASDGEVIFERTS
jgi:hypothetical protein